MNFKTNLLVRVKVTTKPRSHLKFSIFFYREV